jgi:asparagine synthase (glutamine-hydrolysing)
MDIDTYLADDLMPKVDLGSMAHGLEARSPFLDHHLLELTASMPADYLVQGRTTKWFLKQALSSLLPKETLTKRKRGFRLPLDRWFRTDLQPFMRERILEGHPLLWEMFDRSALEQFLNTYVQSRVNMSDHVWAVLWLSEWFASTMRE